MGAGRLSQDAVKPAANYDVVVVGSGYGASAVAARLARRGRSVAILERGREFRAGDFPTNVKGSQQEFQTSTSGGHLGNRLGLFDLYLNRDVHVLVGCGLGGTSLINASVVAAPDPDVFDDPAWPRPIRGYVDQELSASFRRAREMLEPECHPEAKQPLQKLGALRTSARHVNEPLVLPEIAVTFTDRTNAAGVQQKACTHCGNCVSGCNFEAKNTLPMNYLADAAAHGAQIFERQTVTHVERTSRGWNVHGFATGSGSHSAGIVTTADVVLLGAGSLGSTAILARSSRAGLRVSPRLGTRFSTNGDVLAFGYNNASAINGIGLSSKTPRNAAPVGACITGMIDCRANRPMEDRMVIEEGAIPGSLAPLLPAGLKLGAALSWHRWQHGRLADIAASLRILRSSIFGAYTGAVANTQTYLVMAHDDSAGRIELDQDGDPHVEWPGIEHLPIFEKINAKLAACTEATGGVLVDNPTWTALWQHDLITVHPLGGVPMGETAAGGAVNERGQVFTGTDATTVHDGLYVADGSVIPRSLGVNPLLTITALAERCAHYLARDRGW